MGYLKVFLCLALVEYVISKEASLVKPCASTDLECLNKSTNQFLESTHKGIPQYNIKQIDPLILESVEYTPCEDFGLVLQYDHVNITGLRKQKITEFTLNKDTKSVVLTTKADLHIEVDGVADFRKESKKFPGHSSICAEVYGTAKYNYDIEVDDKGVEHFAIGPESITCKIEGTPKISASNREAVNADPIIKAKLDADPEHVAELHRRTICHLVKLSYQDVIHNIRASAKLLPKNAYLTDV